jgi:hypothetical protein
LETTKLSISSIEPTLELDVSSEVLGRLGETFYAYVPLWIDNTTTPALVKQIMAMYYASWVYDRSFAEVETNESQVSYGATLRAWASKLLTDMISGGVTVAEILPGGPNSSIVFYPTDASSTTDALQANTDTDDNSLGPAVFGMSKVFLWLLRLVGDFASTI